jgi:hypothetical protein
MKEHNESILLPPRPEQPSQEEFLADGGHALHEHLTLRLGVYSRCARIGGEEGREFIGGKG